MRRSVLLPLTISLSIIAMAYLTHRLSSDLAALAAPQPPLLLAQASHCAPQGQPGNKPC